MAESKTRYVLMKEVAELTVSTGGTVFGGFVRDFLVHEDGSHRYFSDEKNRQESYSDPSVSPETFEDRTTVPVDIDVRFETKSKFDVFCLELIKRSYTIFQKKNGYACITLHVSLKVALRAVSSIAKSVIKNHLKDVNVNVPGGNFKIDVIIGTESSGLDFMCNGLIMDSEGIRLGPELSIDRSPIGKFRLFQAISEDIKNKKAFALSPKAHRWKKMDSKKGWKILGDSTLVNKPDCAKEDCVICHCENAEYKLNCCSAMYHFECLSKTIKHDPTRCAHCRVGLYIGDEEKKLLELSI